MAWVYHLWLEVRVKKREKPNDKRPWDTRAIGWKEQSFDFYLMGFPGDSMVRNLPALQETQVWSLCWKDPLEKEMTSHSSILAWRIPRTESLVGYSPWGCKESDMTEQQTLSLHFHFFLLRDRSTLMALHSVSLGKKKVRRESRLKDGKTITIGIVKHTYSEKVFSLCYCKFELSIKIPDIKIS